MSGVAGHPPSGGGRAARRVDGRTASLIALAAFVAASVVAVASAGLPLSREVVSLWVLIGLLAASLADVRGWARGVIFDWLPFIAALFTYDLLRGFVGNNPLFQPHVTPQIRADQWLFNDLLPTVELQEHFYAPTQLAVYDVAAWGVYLTHFFAIFVIAAVLWRVARPRFLEFRAMVLTLTVAAFATYAVFPAAPPWMASDDGVIGPVSRVVGGVWAQLDISPAATMFERGSSVANEVAAIPSLHAAYPVLILCFFWSRGGWIRSVCVLYALAMSLTLVYTGEHYVIDVLLGWAYALMSYFAVNRFRARRSRRVRLRPGAAGLGTPY